MQESNTIKIKDRVTITETTRKLLISSYTKTSILPMLGFTNDIKTNRDNWHAKHMKMQRDAECAVVDSPLIR